MPSVCSGVAGSESRVEWGAEVSCVVLRPQVAQSKNKFPLYATFFPAAPHLTF